MPVHHLGYGFFRVMTDENPRLGGKAKRHISCLLLLISFPLSLRKGGFSNLFYFFWTSSPSGFFFISFAFYFILFILLGRCLGRSFGIDGLHFDTNCVFGR
jgi:hypothetical protein